MIIIEDYVSRIEETCGEEKDFVATFKFEKKDEAIKKILGKATKGNSLASVIYELTYKGKSFRLYATGKAIFRDLKTEKELQDFLVDLLS
jgi:hypothetical protein